MNKVSLAIKSVDGENGTLHIDIHDQIGKDWLGEGISSKDVLQKLLENKSASKIALSINSGGGDLFEGLAIFNLLSLQRQKGVSVTADVAGLAASAASLILCAASSVSCPESAVVMIHSPWTFASGNAKELEKAAEELRKAEAACASIYSETAARRGVNLSVDDFLSKMADETWAWGSDAKALGLVDHVTVEPEIRAEVPSIVAQRFSKKPEEVGVFEAPEAEAPNPPKAETSQEPVEKDLAPIPVIVEDCDEIKRLQEENASLTAKLEAIEKSTLIDSLVRDGKVAEGQKEALASKNMAFLREFASMAVAMPAPKAPEPPKSEVLPIVQTSSNSEPTWHGKTIIQLSGSERAQLRQDNPDLYDLMIARVRKNK